MFFGDWEKTESGNTYEAVEQVGAVTSLILRLTPLHQQILALLGPTFEQLYESSN